jgi:hypothetical protein
MSRFIIADRKTDYRLRGQAHDLGRINLRLASTARQGELTLICHAVCCCVWTSTVMCDSPLNRRSTA